jgi:hypothetical protein
MGEMISAFGDVILGSIPDFTSHAGTSRASLASWESIPADWTGDDEYEYQRYLVAVADARKRREGPAPTAAEYDEMLRERTAMVLEVARGANVGPNIFSAKLALSHRRGNG